MVFNLQKKGKRYDGRLDKVYVSIGLCLRQVIISRFYDKAGLLIVGPDCLEFSEYITKNLPFVELESFGTVISETNRIEILDLMMNAKEFTQKEVERALGLSTANTYYHLTLMVKAHILNTRTIGRTVFYSINREYVENVSYAINQYAN